MPRGGYRRGSGAKRGNTNALKSGKRSLKMIALRDAVRAMANDMPELHGDPRKAEHMSYLFRFIGELFLRAAHGQSLEHLRGFNDHQALTYMLKHWTPPKDRRE
jgi:hypothetical protein